jgi:RNA polymerase sigma-70 factor (ECF subfamily)
VAEASGIVLEFNSTIKISAVTRILFPTSRELTLDMTGADFCEAYQRHKDLLYRFARRMTGSNEMAEDLVHECFLMLWSQRVAYQPERGSLRGFLVGVTRNLALKRVSRGRSFEQLEDDIAACEPIDPADRERGLIVAQAVGALPPLQREVLILAEYEEMPLEEIARSVGAELAAVKSRLHRARENLRRMLAPLLESKGRANETR